MADAKARIIIEGDATSLEASARAAKGALADLKGMAIVGLGTALVGGAAAATKAMLDMGASFEKGMREVASLTPVVAGNFDYMSQKTSDLAARMGIDAKDAVKGLYEAISAGVAPAKSLEFLEVAAKAAVGGVTSLDTAVDGMTTVLNAWGSKVGDSTQVADVMFTAVNLGKTTFEAFSSQIGQVAGNASAMGVRFQDTAAALATMTAKGINTMNATTSLKQALVSLQQVPEPMAAAFQKLGVSTGEELVSKMGSAQGAFQALREVADKTDTPLIKMFGSVDALQAVLALTGENFGKASADLDAMNNSTGAAANAFDMLNMSFSRQADILKGQLLGVFRDIGIQMAGALGPALKGINDFVGAARPYLVGFGIMLTQNVVPALGMVAGAIVGLIPLIWPMVAPFVAAGAAMITSIAPFAAAGLAVGLIIKALSDHFGGLGNALVALRPIILAVAAGFGTWMILSGIMSLIGAAQAALGGLTVAQGIYAAAQWVANGALAFFAGILSSPIVLIAILVAAVVGLYMAFQTNFMGITDAVAAAWAAIVTGFGQIVAFIAGIGTTIASAASTAWTGLVDGAVAIWEWVGGVFQSGVEFLGEIVQGVKDRIAAGFQAAVDIGAAIFEQFKPVFVVLGVAALLIVGPFILAGMTIKAVFDIILSAASAVAAGVSSFFGGLGAGAADGTSSVAGSMDAMGAKAVETANGMNQSGGGLVASLSAHWASLKGSTIAVWTSMSAAVVAGFQAFAGFVRAVATAIGNFFITVWTWIRTNVIARVASMIQVVVGVLAGWYRWIVGLLSGVARFFWSAFVAIGKTVSSLVRKVATVISDVFTAVGNWLGGFFDILGGIVFDAWKAIFDTVRGALKAIWDAITSVFRGIVQGIGDAMSAAGGIVQTIFGKIASLISSIGAAMGPAGGFLTNIGTSIGNAMGSVGSSIKGLISSAIGGLKSAGGAVQDFFGGAVAKVRAKFGGMFKGLKFEGAENAFDDAAPALEGAAGNVGGGVGQALTDGMDIGSTLGGEDEGGAAKKAKKEKKPKGPKGAKDGEGPEVASKLADIAKKVADAIQSGLAALEQLAAAEMPPRESWATKLEALVDFVQTATSKFQDMAAATLTPIDLKDGLESFQTARVDALKAALGGMEAMFATIGKAIGVAGSLVDAEFPEPKALDALGAFVQDLTKRSIAIAAGITKEEGERLKSIGDAFGSWVDLFGKAIAAAASLKDVNVGALAAAGPAVASYLTQVAGVADAFRKGLEAAIPAPEDQAKGLSLSKAIAGTFGEWVGLIGAIGRSAADIAKIPSIPDVGPALTVLLGAVAAAGGTFVVAIQGAHDSLREAQQSLGLSAAIAGTFGAWFRMLGELGKLALDIRKIRTLDAAALSAPITAALGAIAAIGFVFVEKLQAIPLKEAAAALNLSQAIAGTFAAWIGTLKGLVDLVGAAGKLGKIDPTAMSKVGAFLADVVAAGLKYVVDALKMGEAKAKEALGVSMSVAQTFGAWVGALAGLTDLLGKIATTTVAPPDVIASVLANVDTVRAAFQDQAVAWADAQIDAAETLGKVKEFAEVLKTVGEILKAAQGLVISEIAPIDWDVLFDLSWRTFAIVDAIQGWAAAYAAGTEAVDAVIAQLAAFATVMKHVGDILKSAVGMVIGEVAAIDTGALALVLENATAVRVAVEDLARRWYENATAAQKSGTAVEAFARVMKSVAETLSTALGMKIGEASLIAPKALAIVMANAMMVLYGVQAASALWTKTADEATALGDRIETFAKAIKNSGEVLKVATGAAIGEAKLLSPADLALVMGNATLVLAAVQSAANTWNTAGAKAADVAARIETFAKAIKGAGDALASGAGMVLADVTALSRDALATAVGNAQAVLGAVQAAAVQWATNAEAATDLSARIDAYSKSVKGAADAVGAGAEAGFIRATSIAEASLTTAVRNAERVRSAVQAVASVWTTNIEQAKDLSTRIDLWSKAVKAGADALKAATDLFGALKEAKSPGDLKAALGGVARNIGSMLAELANAFDTVEAQAGTLKKAGDLNAILKPAIEAVGKVIETLSWDNLSKNPLINMKLGSGFMTGTRKNRMEQLGTQVSEGIRRMANAVIEGLKGVVVPTDLGLGFDQMAGAFDSVMGMVDRLSSVAKDAKDRWKKVDMTTTTASIRKSIQAMVDGMAGITVPSNVSDVERLADAYSAVLDILERIASTTIDTSKIGTVVAAAALLAQGAAALEGSAPAMPRPDMGTPYDPNADPGRPSMGTPYQPGGPVPGVGPSVATSAGPIPVLITNPTLPAPAPGPGPVPPSPTVIADVKVQIGEETLSRVIQKSVGRDAFQGTTQGTET